MSIHLQNSTTSSFNVHPVLDVLELNQSQDRGNTRAFGNVASEYIQEVGSETSSPKGVSLNYQQWSSHSRQE